MSNMIAIDILSDCSYAGQSPVFVASADQVGLVGAADERFFELALPAFSQAAARVGVALMITSDASQVDDVRRSWGDQDAYRQAWQAVHDAVDVDLLALARQALLDVAE